MHSQILDFSSLFQHFFFQLEISLKNALSIIPLYWFISDLEFADFCSENRQENVFLQLADFYPSTQAQILSSFFCYLPTPASLSRPWILSFPQFFLKACTPTSEVLTKAWLKITLQAFTYVCCQTVDHYLTVYHCFVCGRLHTFILSIFSHFLSSVIFLCRFIFTF